MPQPRDKVATPTHVATHVLQPAEQSRMSCFLLCVSLAVLFVAVVAEFNYTKCPHPWELQSDAVK